MIDNFLFFMVGAGIGFILALTLACGSVGKWKACGGSYKSGQVEALIELYRKISDLRSEATGASADAYDKVMVMISQSLPKNIREE